MNGSKPGKARAEAAAGDTRDEIFRTAERLFTTHGFQNVSVRDIAAEADVNLSSINYHYGSKDALLFEIFDVRSAELNQDRTTMLGAANAAHGGRPPVREVLKALFAPPLIWMSSTDHRRTSMSFLLRARSEGTPQILDALGKNVEHLKVFAAALRATRPDLAEDVVAWRLHFALGMSHNNRFVELEQLRRVSSATRGISATAVLDHMLDFAEAGFEV